ncbi:MAG: VWA domain-containing protein, partial [Candidatus Zixiibacteriota bacterium]
MKAIVKLSLILLLLFGTHVFAQDSTDFIGPEGDLYYIGDSLETIAIIPANNESSSDYLKSSSANSVDMVVVSQLDCASFPNICSFVEVLDEDGNPIGNMTADSFCVFQDDDTITAFTIEELTLDSCVTSVALVIDVSGSMNDNNKIGAAKAAARAFVRSMDIYDRVALIEFSSCYNVLVDFTSDTAILIDSINTMSAQGNTAVFDGIWKGVDLTIPEVGSKAVIALTDGMENYSQLCGGAGTPDGLWIGNPPIWWWWGTPDPEGWTDDSTLITNLANSGGVPIYTISLGSSFDPQYLIDLAAATGGTYYHAPTGNDIAQIYETIKYRLCSRYLICYDSPDTLQNGEWHTVQICRKDQYGDCGPCDIDSCQETDTPNINRTPPTTSLDTTCQRWDADVEICVNVTDLDTPQEDLIVRLFYRNSPTASYTSVTMNRTDSTYCYTIPGASIPCDADSIYYYITASDGQATVSSPPHAPSSAYYVFPVCLNSPPTVDGGIDQTIWQCTPAQICWTISYGDVDGNLMTVQKITGPGTLTGSQFCFTPTTTMNYEFVFKATDSCGATDYDTVVIFYSRNNAPVANAGTDQSYFQCSPTEICWPVSCSDLNNNLSECALITSVGTYNGTNICFTPDTAGNYTFILK